MLAYKFIKLMSLNLQETKLYQFFSNSKDQVQLLRADQILYDWYSKWLYQEGVCKISHVDRGDPSAYCVPPAATESGNKNKTKQNSVRLSVYHCGSALLL